jgi:hypothetical protein
MGKLYVFGIGGTGSRVIKSLTMLLASGVEMSSDKIVPIIIDPDVSAADLTRTVDLMRTYGRIRSRLQFDSSNKSNFFRTEIKELLPGYRLELENTQNLQFGDYIQLDMMSKENAALTRMLFSEDNLKSSMDVGFKGNPNIGSVVLNRFTQSSQFESFASDFEEGDRIFIISSIFGGTGASGFPVLAKRLRTLQSSGSTVSNSDRIQKSIIGAITVLPYFNVTVDESSAIDSSTFISKTKAALSYYNKNMTELDALYYIGDDVKKQYDNNEGGQYQQNDAHFVELAAALSIVDFDREFTMRDGNNISTVYKEFGIKDDCNPIILPNLCDTTYDVLARPLTQLTLFSKFMKFKLVDSLRTNQPWTADLKAKRWFDDRFIKSSLNPFLDAYMNWLKEMQDNNRSFAPFNLEDNPKAVFELVRGCQTKKVFNSNSNYALFDSFLNSEEKKLNKGGDTPQWFMDLFFIVTKVLIDKKIKL